MVKEPPLRATKHGEDAVEFAAHPDDARSGIIISAVRITPQYQHARLRIFNRGGGSGEIVVNAGDARIIAARLLCVQPAALEQAEASI